MMHPEQTANGDETPALGSTDRPARFRTILFAILAVASLARLAMLVEYWSNNPFARAPIADGQFYWDLAQAYAAGNLIGDTPFLSAPLYPYALGILRALGGGLILTYLVQIGCHLATAALLAWIARRRFGESTGLLAAGLFCLMSDPAIGCFRVLSNSLQLMFVALTWAAVVWAQQGRSTKRWGAVGIVLGITCLTNGSLVLVAPALALWIVASGAARSSAIRHAGVMLVGCAVSIAPATVHNYRVCGELIPISAHSGLTLRHGNAPGANGTYLAASGVAADKTTQHLDTFRIYEHETGRTATWRAVDRFYANLAVGFWRDDPVRAAKLALRKAYWFLSARHYGDIHVPTLEAASGLDKLWHLAPLATPFLLPLAIIAAAGWLRRWRTCGVELVMLVIPWLVVVVFWYTPRYRLPAVPVIAVGAAWVLQQAWRERGRVRMRILAGAAIVTAAGLQIVNEAIRFDSPDGVRAAFHIKLGQMMDNDAQRPDAVEQYGIVLQSEPRHPEAHHLLGAALVKLGSTREGITHLRNAADSAPEVARYQAALGSAYAGARQFDKAEHHLSMALRLNPEDPEAHHNLAATMMVLGRLPGAIHHFREVLRLDPDALSAWFFLADALDRSGDRDGAAETLRKAIKRARALGRPDEAFAMERKLQKYERR